MSLKAIVALIFTIVVWGLAPALVRSFSLAAGPWDSMFIRLTSVALLCIALLPISGWYIARADWSRIIVAYSLGMFGYFVGSIFGFAYIGAGPGGLIMATQPLIIAALASLIGVEKLGLATIAGFIVSFAGTTYLFAGDLVLSGESPVLGAIWIIYCSIAFAANVVLSKPLVKKYGPFRTTTIGMILTAIPALVFYRPSVWNVIASLDWKAWASLIYLGPIGTILAVVAWNIAIGQLRPTTVGASLYAIPVLSIIAGWALLAEPLQSQVFIAAAIILAGVAIAEFGNKLRS